MTILGVLPVSVPAAVPWKMDGYDMPVQLPLGGTSGIVNILDLLVQELVLLVKCSTSWLSM
jgi:hypothetical protein